MTKSMLHIKAIEQYTGVVNYGRVVNETKRYIDVRIKGYYSNGNDLNTRLFKREGAMYNDYHSINFYAIYPEELKF